VVKEFMKLVKTVLLVNLMYLSTASQRDLQLHQEKEFISEVQFYIK